MVERGRVHVPRGGETGEGSVLYWMSREQRARDNWALLYAQQQAILRRAPLHVVFCKVRCMSYSGTRKKSDVDAFVRRLASSPNEG